MLLHVHFNNMYITLISSTIKLVTSINIGIISNTISITIKLVVILVLVLIIVLIAILVYLLKYRGSYDVHLSSCNVRHIKTCTVLPGNYRIRLKSLSIGYSL